jgi:hypothetical protein
MIARLKLKNFVDPDDAYEAQQFYNVILQQLQQMVNIVTDPSDEAYNTCLEILLGFTISIQFDELIKMACERNVRVGNYIGDKYKLRENSKLRPILEKLRNHSQVMTVSEKPIVLKWNNIGHGLSPNEGSICDVCDACDESSIALKNESSSNDTDNDIVMTPNALSHTSHAAHRSNNPMEESTSQISSGNGKGFKCFYCTELFDSDTERLKHRELAHPGQLDYPTPGDFDNRLNPNRHWVAE